MSDKDKEKNKYILPNNCPVKFHLVRSYNNNVDSVIGFGYIKNGDLHIPKYPRFSAGNKGVITGNDYDNVVYGKSSSVIDKKSDYSDDNNHVSENVLPNVYKKGQPYRNIASKYNKSVVPLFNSNVYDLSGVETENQRTSGDSFIYNSLSDQVGYNVSYYPVDYDPNKLKNPKPVYKPYVYNFGDVNSKFYDRKAIGSGRRNYMTKEELKKYKNFRVLDSGNNVIYEGNFDGYEKYRENHPYVNPAKIEFDKRVQSKPAKPVYREEKPVFTKDVMYSKYMTVRRDPKNKELNDYELYNKYGVFNPWDKRFKEESSKLKKE